MHFRGQHKYAIDEKNRLAIPAAIRDAMDPETHGKAFIALPGPNERLWLWPERIFERWVARQESNPGVEEEIFDFERMIFSQSAHLPLDGHGRVRLPEWMVTRFRLSGEVVIIGNKDHLELYPPEDWREEEARLIPATSELYRRARPSYRRAERRPEDI